LNNNFSFTFNFTFNITLIQIKTNWGLGIGDWGLGPIANRQSPIPIIKFKS